MILFRFCFEMNLGESGNQSKEEADDVITQPAKGQVLETKIQTASRSRDLLYLTIDFSFWGFAKNAELGRFFLWWDEMNGQKNMALENMKTRIDFFGERRRVVTACPERRPEILNLPDFYWGNTDLES